MALKTNYKNGVSSGLRQYAITKLENGKNTIVDATEYQENPDKFGAKDINATNERVNNMLQRIPGFSIPAAGWVGGKYTLSNSLITAGCLLDIYFAESSVMAAQKANIIGTTQAGKMILTAKRIPAVALTVEVIKVVNL